MPKGRGSNKRKKKVNRSWLQEASRATTKTLSFPKETTSVTFTYSDRLDKSMSDLEYTLRREGRTIVEWKPGDELPEHPTFPTPKPSDGSEPDVFLVLLGLRERKAKKMTLKEFKSDFDDYYEVEINWGESFQFMKSKEVFKYRGLLLGIRLRGKTSPFDFIPFPDGENSTASVPDTLWDYIAWDELDNI